MAEPSRQAATPRAPSVLVVLVVRDAAAWLRGCLSSLAAQTYPRMGVVGVDNGSKDGSRTLLEHALGNRRVLALDEDRGLAGAVGAAIELPAARDADYLLVIHDDTALDPDAVAHLVEAAVGIPGVRDVGVVGPKVVDWDDPRQLRDVGRSADRFGHPYNPLQPGEIDQGQFDRVLEVLCVSTCAMLISRGAWARAGLFDERLDPQHEALDFCWRVRLAGFRVLMTPLARARHREAAGRGERPERHRHRSERYLDDRAALASMLKNYGVLSLLWLLPLAAALGVVRLLYLALSRRFEEAYDLLAAWGWNVVHLPSTIRRRVRAQSVRRVPDRRLRGFMESAGVRLPRWFEAAGLILEEQREIDEADEGAPVARRLRDRTASLVGSHPIVVASFLALVVGLVTFRDLYGPEPLAGGALPAFPPTPNGFFAELLSGFRTTGLGGTLAASPALAPMGGLSWLLFGSAALAQKVMLAGLPLMAGVLMYRALVRLTSRPGPSVVAAGAYALSGLLLWAVSEGRLDLLVSLAILPAAAERLEVAFGVDPIPDGRWRFVAGLGVTLAVGIAFFPGTALAVAALALVQVVAGRARGRGIALTVAGALAATVLLFPFVPTLLADDGAALRSLIGTTDLGALGRMSPGPGPGTWIVAAFLPIASLLAFALVGAGLRGRAARAALAALAGLALAWLSSAGHLPAAATNAPAYLGLAAVAEATLVGYGLAAVASGLGRETFGLRQVLTGLLGLILGGGLVLQAASAMIGGWATGGPDVVPPAWAVVESGARGDFRVLWIGDDVGDAFPPPGGDPQGLAPAGDASLRYGLTGRGGATALDIGRTLTGRGAGYLGRALNEILSGTTRHGGALLAAVGVRFVVARDDDLPPGAEERLGAQVDLDHVPAVDLVIYRNGVALPPAAVLPDDRRVERAVLSNDLAEIAMLTQLRADRSTQTSGGWAGTAEVAGLVVVQTEFGPAWRLEASGDGATGDPVPEEAFGWATSFPVAAGAIRVRFTDQWLRTAEMVALGLVWVVALWVTRKPVAR